MEEQDVNRAVEKYRQTRPLCENFTTKLRELFEQLLEANDVEVENVESRTKSVDRFSEKIKRGDKSYDDPLSQVTDLCGLRIVTYYLEDVDRVGDIIQKEFDVDDQNSLDKSEAIDPDRFGYLSVHYVVSLDKGRAHLTEWRPFSGLKAEIQVRTVLQHAWAAIDHKLRYKAAREVPTNLKRQLFRLSALLELADEEFAQLKGRSEATTEEYVNEVERGQYDIEVNLDSLDSYLQSSGQLERWAKEAVKAGFRTIQEQDYDATYVLRTLLKIVQISGMKRIAELDSLLTDASGWGPEVLQQVSELSADSGFVPFAVPHDVLTVLVIKARSAYLDEAKISETRYLDPFCNAILKVAGVAS